MRHGGLGVCLGVCVALAAACGSGDSSTSDGGDDGSISPFGDGAPFGSDASTGCQPKTCASAGYTCGMNGDGCGNVIDCGQCASPNFCGGGGYSQCGIGVGGDGGPIVADGGTCTPTTCQQLGYNCGPAGDGCGGLLQCGNCTLPDICGGGGKPSVCGGSTPCTGLCLQQVNCDGGTPTTLKGRVVAGTLPKYGSPDPIPNVLVYVPNSTVQAFTKGVQCSQCGADVTGNPLVQTTTAVDGTFTLTNVPAGNNIPVVIQLGRWRRQVSFNVSACASASVGDIRMPRNKSEGDIPFTALSTGAVDGMECVLLKMGVDQAEFTNPAGGGRIEIYHGNGAQISNQTPAESSLVNTTTAMDQYDQIFFPCWGSQVNKATTPLANLVSYANAGGRVFATHFSYTWLYTNVPFSQTATWNVNANSLNSTTAEVDTSFTKGKTFAQWLALVNALNISTNPPDMTLNAPRHDFDSVTSPALRWMYTVGQNPNFPLHYTFDTPWNQTSQCGRVVFSDFHVTGSNTSGVTFPNECTSSPMTGQEKALEYMIWDLASCVPPPPKPACTPLTCQQQNINCGPAGDGCGGLLNCGTCSGNQTCGGGGSGQCGGPDAGCTPMTCQQLGFNCGPAGDGCGGLLNCGTCIAPDTCGGGGQSGVCGHLTVK